MTDFFLAVICTISLPVDHSTTKINNIITHSTYVHVHVHVRFVLTSDALANKLPSGENFR